MFSECLFARGLFEASWDLTRVNMSQASSKLVCRRVKMQWRLLGRNHVNLHFTAMQVFGAQGF